jgi:hypothetical protein
LDSRPGLARDAYNIYKGIEDNSFLEEYFGPLKRTPFEGQSPEEFTFENESHRTAKKPEVLHLACIATYDWKRHWNGGGLGTNLKGTGDECDVPLLFRLPTGWNYDHSNKQQLVAFQSYHEV